MVDLEALDDTIFESSAIPDDAYPVALFNASGARSRAVTVLFHASSQKGAEWLSVLYDPSGVVGASPDEERERALLKLRSYDHPTWATLRTWNLAARRFQKPAIYQQVANVLLERGWIPSSDGDGEETRSMEP